MPRRRYEAERQAALDLLRDAIVLAESLGTDEGAAEASYIRNIRGYILYQRGDYGEALREMDAALAAQRRLRPILLTTATTVGGLLPLWLGGGAMWEAMAVAIIFGLLFATALTLGVVPILYSLFYRVRYDSIEG